MTPLDIAAQGFVALRSVFRRVRASALANSVRLHRAVSIDARWRWLTEPLSPTEKCCIFVSYTPDGQLPPRAIEHARKWQECGYEVLFVIVLDDFAVEPTVPFGHAIARENAGFDFAAWALPIGELDWSATQVLTTVNDSVYASDKLGDAIRRAESIPAEVVGFTESRDYRWHLQSYAWLFKREAIANPAFARFWSQPTGSRDHAILVFETQMAQQMRKAGLRAEALFPSSARLDPTFDDWLDYAHTGLPYVKRRAMARHYEEWAPYLSELGFDAQMIADDLPEDPAPQEIGRFRRAARRAMR